MSKYTNQILLSIFFSILISIIFTNHILSGFNNLIILLVIIGLILSFLNKEKKISPYLKLAFLNSLIFSLLFSLVFFINFFSTDSQFRENYNNFFAFLKLIPIFIVEFLFIGLIVFFGNLAGMVIREIIIKLKNRSN